jgi:hypothetical protein
MLRRAVTPPFVNGDPVDLIVLVVILLGSMSVGIGISRASVEVIFKIMRVAPSAAPDPLRTQPVAADAPHGPVIRGGQELV